MLTQLIPATGPAKTTSPAAGARTDSPTRAAMSTPRCPGPYGPARASKPRTNAPVTGIHNAGTRVDGGVSGAAGCAVRAAGAAAGAATGTATGTTAPAAKSMTSTNSLQSRPGSVAASG
jgi:hypothetical protein